MLQWLRRRREAKTACAGRRPGPDPRPWRRYPTGRLASASVLRERKWLRHDHKPLVAYVGRLDAQKGVHLIHHAIFRSLHKGAQFVLLGSSPEPGINAHFWQLKHHLNDNPDCPPRDQLRRGTGAPDLRRRRHRGRAQPLRALGLTQMIALRYGAVPVVRAVGGLADTVFDRDYSNRPEQERNGYVFHQTDNAALESALDRAIGMRLAR